ncbi:hypothetical protein Ciccas_003972 [Cichlidogyrus casuarinus]|uniref:Uncharacterized protein n=1 Tax=Cichlidogyrus casuarinus TaxID=1844966 RepID=A0ABD2QDR5_9PLAT
MFWSAAELSFESEEILKSDVLLFKPSAVSDFVSRLLNLESDSAVFAIPWFVDEGALFKLVNYFSVDFSEDFQDMTATFFDQFFVNLRDHLQSEQRDSVRELTKQVTTSDFVQPLLDALICGQAHLPVNAARVLLALIDKRKKETSFPLGSGLGDFGNVYDLFSEANVRSNADDSSAASASVEDPKQKHVQESTELVYRLLCEPSYLERLRKALLTSSSEDKAIFSWNRVALCQFLSAVVSCDCPRELDWRKARESASQKTNTNNNHPIMLFSQFAKAPTDKFGKPQISDQAKLQLLQSLLDEQIVKTVMDLTIEFSNCTFLHETMRKLIDCVFVYAGFEHITQHEASAVVDEAESLPVKQPELVRRLFTETRAIEWLVKMRHKFSWASLPNVKPGYFGHVLLFVNEIAAFEKECGGGLDDCASEADVKEFRDLIEEEIVKLKEATDSTWDTSCLNSAMQSMAMDISFLNLAAQATPSNIMQIFGESFMQKEFNGPLSFSSFRAMDGDALEKNESASSDDEPSPNENDDDDDDSSDDSNNDSDDKNDLTTAPRIIKQIKSDPKV